MLSCAFGMRRRLLLLASFLALAAPPASAGRGMDVICIPGPWVIQFTQGTETMEALGPEIMKNILANDGYCDGARIIIDGNIAKGEAESLATARAIVVREYLVDHGAAPQRIYVRGLATTRPAPAGRKTSVGPPDARVEIWFAPSEDY
jgi:hypothetical protein